MATPASSAWHRRRNLLATTPSSKVNAVREAGSLKPNGSSEPPGALNPSPGGTHQGKYSRTLPPATSHVPRGTREHPHESLLCTFGRLSGPRGLNAQFSLLQSVGMTAVCVVLTHLVTRFGSVLLLLLASVSSNWQYHPTREVSSVLEVLFKSFAFLLCSMTLFTVHFIFTQALEKQIRSSCCFMYAHGSSENEYFRLRLLHSLGCASGCVLQAVLVGYIVPGSRMTSRTSIPLASGIHPTAISRHVFPTWSVLAHFSLCALFAGLIYASLRRESAILSSRNLPFFMPFPRRLAVCLSKAVLMSGLSVMLSVIPATLFYWLLCRCPFCLTEVSGLSLINFFGITTGSCSCAFITLLSWNILAMTDYVIEGSDTDLTFSARTEPSSKYRDDIIMEDRDKISILAQQYATHNLFSKDTQFVIGDGLRALNSLCHTQEGLSEFPGFLDSSGDVWEFCLSLCLSPLEALEHILRDRSSHSFGLAPSVARRKSRLAWPSPSAMSDSRALSPDVNMCISASEAVGVLVAASYEFDRFGVVQRTLPRLMRSLLRCKEQMDLTLSEQRSWSASASENTESSHYVLAGAMRWCRRTLLIQDERHALRAVDDALTLSIYRIIGVFRNHMYSFVEGVEVAWDRSLDRQLMSFLDYLVS